MLISLFLILTSLFWFKIDLLLANVLSIKHLSVQRFDQIINQQQYSWIDHTQSKVPHTLI